MSNQIKDATLSVNKVLTENGHNIKHTEITLKSNREDTDTFTYTYTPIAARGNNAPDLNEALENHEYDTDLKQLDWISLDQYWNELAE